MRATGMPLGLMTGMDYEEVVALVEPDDVVLLSSDGITEAHGTTGEMFGFERMVDVAARADGRNIVEVLKAALEAFTASDWEQEDDITLLSVHRSGR